MDDNQPVPPVSEPVPPAPGQELTMVMRWNVEAEVTKAADRTDLPQEG